MSSIINNNDLAAQPQILDDAAARGANGDKAVQPDCDATAVAQEDTAAPASAAEGGKNSERRVCEHACKVCVCRYFFFIFFFIFFFWKKQLLRDLSQRARRFPAGSRPPRFNRRRRSARTPTMVVMKAMTKATIRVRRSFAVSFFLFFFVFFCFCFFFFCSRARRASPAAAAALKTRLSCALCVAALVFCVLHAF
jgi:hypothetical protein